MSDLKGFTKIKNIFPQLHPQWQNGICLRQSCVTPFLIPLENPNPMEKDDMIGILPGRQRISLCRIIADNIVMRWIGIIKNYWLLLKKLHLILMRGKNYEANFSNFGTLIMVIKEPQKREFQNNWTYLNNNKKTERIKNE